MNALLALLLTLRDYYHIRHLLAGGASFFGDHEFLKAYEPVDDQYDLLAEILRAEELLPDLFDVHALAALRLQELKSRTDTWQALLDLELKLQLELITVTGDEDHDCSLALQNLLATFAQDSRHRIFFIKARLA